MTSTQLLLTSENLGSNEDIKKQCLFKAELYLWELDVFFFFFFPPFICTRNLSHPAKQRFYRLVKLCSALSDISERMPTPTISFPGVQGLNKKSR